MSNYSSSKSLNIVAKAATDLKLSFKHFLHKMQISFFNVVRDCKSLPRGGSVLGAIFGDHGIDFLFQVGEKKCFAQRGIRLAALIHTG